MPDSVGERTEAPTPRKRQESREEGNIARSQDLTAGIMILAGVLLLGIFAKQMYYTFLGLLDTMLAGQFGDSATTSVGDTWQASLEAMSDIWLPMGVSLAGVALITGALQTGFLISPKAMAPKFSRVNPAKGLKQLFSLRALMRFVMSMSKVTVVVLVAAIVIYFDYDQLLSLIRLEPISILAAAASMVFELAIIIAVVLLVLGIIDYVYQRWQTEQDLRMTKHEVKEEMKQMDGDPHMKQRRAQVARQLVMQRIATDVPQADVIVTNPTHFAIALKYDADDMGAPKVVAKGADFLALRIRQIASANSIPIVERPPLARAMYKQVEVGQEIPAEFYAAVAEILAYVYRINGNLQTA